MTPATCTTGTRARRSATFRHRRDNWRRSGRRRDALRRRPARVHALRGTTPLDRTGVSHAGPPSRGNLYAFAAAAREYPRLRRFDLSAAGSRGFHADLARLLDGLASTLTHLKLRLANTAATDLALLRLLSSLPRAGRLERFTLSITSNPAVTGRALRTALYGIRTATRVTLHAADNDRLPCASDDARYHRIFRGLDALFPASEPRLRHYRLLLPDRTMWPDWIVYTLRARGFVESVDTLSFDHPVLLGRPKKKIGRPASNQRVRAVLTSDVGDDVHGSDHTCDCSDYE